MGDLPFATIERRAEERIDNLDQRGGSYNGVELVEHERFERVKRVAQETVSARQPEVSFSVMGPLLLRPRLVDEVIMVPGQHKEISGIVWSHDPEFISNGFDVFERDYYVIKMRANGLERCVHGGAIERFDHVEKA